MPDAGERLVTDQRFFYSGTEITGQTELLAGAVRRRLPGELGRRRARQHLLDQAGDLVPQLVGRARSDLQYRLEESGRRLAQANQGAKSTFLRSLGLAQLMMQCGMFVPAQSFRRQRLRWRLHTLQAGRRCHHGARETRRGAEQDERYRGRDNPELHLAVQ